MAAQRKVVVVDAPELISPLMMGKHKAMDDFTIDRESKPPAGKRRGSQRQPSAPSSPRLKPGSIDRRGSLSPNTEGKNRAQNHALGEVFMQMAGLIRDAKTTRRIRKTKKQFTGDAGVDGNADLTGISPSNILHKTHHAARRPSNVSQASQESLDLDLEKLEDLLEKGLMLSNVMEKTPTRPSYGPSSRQSSTRKLRRVSINPNPGSDTDYQDGDIRVPSCEAILDNSKTMSYTGGSSDAADVDKESSGGRDEWETFKFEIVRLIHTLRLKGWRQVPMERSKEIDVERLSGALTNAVYVVSPPPDIANGHAQQTAGQQEPTFKKPPPKLLLRVYGPQVEHLIDREAELQILRRLSRQNIGARMLGTFTNGRFEQYFYARTLTPQDLRVPETSDQIAKRMRELHEGIELLDEERTGGPFVWRNWDKWVARCGEILKFVDAQVPPGRSDAPKQRDLVLGVEWPVFLRVVERYRKWLAARYGGLEHLQEQLVFAHNDTQYGNILRLVPQGESPLLLPANEHKRLIVIDFEYSNANVVGFEFANHFSEWCYNYHDPKTAFVCNAAHYPTLKEQRRFIRAYIKHRPEFPNGSSATTPTPGGLSSAPSFVLDSRTPPSLEQLSSSLDPAQVAVDKQIDHLMEETRVWRVACSAHWVAWGVVQAHVPGMPSEASSSGGEEVELSAEQGTDPLSADAQASMDDLADKRPDTMEEGEAAEDDEFDYLRYARDRAMLFWGDVIQLGLVEEGELPEELMKAAKVIQY